MNSWHDWVGRWWQPVVVSVVLVAVGAAAGAIGFSVQPAVSGPVGPGMVVVDPGVRGGDTVVGLPPLGDVIAETHAGPIAFDARLERIDLDQASAVVRGENPAGALRTQIEADLRPLLGGLARQSFVVALVSGLVAGLLLPWRRVRTVLAVVAGSVGFVAVSGAVAFNTFDPASFDHPRFEGALERAPDVVNTVQRHIETVGEVEGRLGALSDRIAGLYQTVEGDTGSTAGTTILHVSDIHSNPVGVQLVEETAERFGVDAIVDTGDLTSFGNDIEAVIAGRVAAIETPYYVVPGNHDHPSIRRALTDAGVEVLDPGVVDIDGITLLGVGEPTFTAENDVPAALHDANLEASAEEIRSLVFRHRPEVVAVHNRRQLTASLGLFDIGLAGHTHTPKVRYGSGSAVVETGSAGATGVGALMSTEDLPYQMQLLHFEDERLVAIDRLEFRGTDGEFSLERVLIDPTEIDGYPTDAGDVGPLIRRPRPPR